MDCLFCKISRGQIPADIVYQDEEVLVINDIQPQAPIHQLIIPHRHIASLADLTAEDVILTGHMIYTAKRLAKQAAAAEQGYRLVMNCGAQGGQTIYHLHLHLLAGRQMQWPPG